MLRRPTLRSLAATLAATTLLGLGTGTALAAPPGSAPPTAASRVAAVPAQGHARPPAAYAPTGVSDAGTDRDAVQIGRLTPAQLPPARPALPHQTAAQSAHSAAAQSCTPADFSGRTGTALAAYLESSTTDCVNTLFALTGKDAHGVFQESQAIPVAEALKTVAAAYKGDDSSGIQQLVLYLRAAYYVQFYDAADVGPYDDKLTAPVTAAMDAFFANPHSRDVTGANGAILGETVTLTDSANLHQHYLDVYQRLYTAYSSSWDAVSGMDTVVYNANSALWRAANNPAFVTAISGDHGLVNTLNAFVLNHTGMLGGDNTFMVAGAGQDLAAYVQFPALRPTVQPLMLGMLHTARMTGPMAALWVAVAQQSVDFDAANCATYGTCNLPDRLKAAVLTASHTCTPTITVAAQALDATQLAAVCDSLAKQVPWFQNLVRAGGPIPGQTITGETMVVFASRQDYQIYGPAIYNIDTDNGGITETGDPSRPGNAAFSVMYQAPYATDFTANIWNLNHEFTHYLDAVYNTRGDFTAETAVPDVWWIEGIAEYTSYTYRGVADTEALADAPQHTYALSTLFQNTYGNSDTTRTYPWGYLAVRYMWERHPDVMYAMLGHFRTGDYAGGCNVYNALGTKYDADFASWLNGLASAGSGSPTAAFGTSIDRLSVAFTDKSTETGNGRITGWSWNFGDGAGANTQNPTHSYAKPGSYTATLTVTDSNGHTATTTAQVAVSNTAACTGADQRLLDRNCYRADQSAAAGGEDYLYIYLPAGTTQLTVSTTGGSGTAYLYYSPSGWATKSHHSVASTHPGTAQSLTVTNKTAGYRYITLYGATAFNGVTVSAGY
ncbi:microbial collagenase [Kitasatospora sp. GP30]|uniref:collagenase n=1 Tax=Kitasatospora sp. GP30 TaxID=3035084 RepID=UPI000CA6CC69|nr:collagenase [Kitasatospora sp. GP30]MDH6138881.1 microbial collagenase [Kitasatospora sp. GP30]